MDDFTIDPEFEQLNRKLSKQEFDNLSMLIETDGPREGSVIVALIDGKKILLDGHNTVKICREKGFKLPPIRVMQFPDREAALDRIHLMQRARRNLTQEEMKALRRQRIPLVAAGRVDGKSTQMLADEFGVSQTTILDDIKLATAQGCVVEPSNGEIVGKDGKKRKSKPLCARCARNLRIGKEATKGCDMCRQLREPKKRRPVKQKDVLHDAFGVEVPKHCRDAYADPWLQQTIDYLGVVVTDWWKQGLADALKKRARHYPYLNVKDFIDGYASAGHFMDDLLNHLKENRPAGVCPMCQGERCAECRMSGMVPRELHAKLKKKEKVTA